MFENYVSFLINEKNKEAWVLLVWFRHAHKTIIKLRFQTLRHPKLAISHNLTLVTWRPLTIYDRHLRLETRLKT